MQVQMLKRTVTLIVKMKKTQSLSFYCISMYFYLESSPSNASSDVEENSDTNSEDEENSKFEFYCISMYFYLESSPSNASSDVEEDSDTNSVVDENSKFEFLLYIHVFLLRIKS